MRYVVLLSCPDTRGIVSSLAESVWKLGGNIVHADYHSDKSCGLFLTRMEWDMDDPGDAVAVEAAVGEVAARLGATWKLGTCPRTGPRPRILVAVSKQHHCLMDLLMRTDSGEIPATICGVVSNHEDLRPLCEREGQPFFSVPVQKGQPAPVWEGQWLELVKETGADLIVLAKYMQILSADFLRAAPSVINIHHSFLPAFRGAKPYHQAYAKGVKLIGATAHYATVDLDEGPIIEQDVMRVSHRDDERDFMMKGQDLERNVLARAVKAHLEHRVIGYNGKTVVFN